jgi:plasmid stabilization system protein ParE
MRQLLFTAAKRLQRNSSVTHHDTEFEGGARIVRHGRYVVFQLAEVAVPRALFAEILRRVDQLRPKSTPLAP